MPLKKLAKIVDESLRDSDRARKSASDPRFREGLRSDRRKTLSSFETVQRALADREKAAKAKAAKAKAAKSQPNRPKAGAKKA
ncbi:MAG: hypothetical protein M3O91_01820 [Chloroflexota bacterium]|nr:hypothetical protein [Chloroflexota bacterium]